MKTINYLKAFVFAIASLIAVNTVAAQEARPADAPPPAEQRQAADQLRRDHGNLLQQLGLLDEQVQQIRKLNAEKRPLMGEALKRLHEATRALDAAIYADQLNVADIQLRLKETELAQAELSRLRYTNELAVRRILSQEQLVRFRELRQQYEKMRPGIEQMHRFNRQRPNKDNTPTPDAQPQNQRVIRPKAVI